jgi:tetratricopeptide (TPR) repeat protein
MIDDLRQSIRASAAVSSGGTAAPQEVTSDKVRAHMQKAQDAESAGEPMVAVAELQLALAIEPDNEWLQTEHDRLSKAVARALADNYEKQACYEEKTGNWAAAANSWARVADGRPESDEAARYTAEALVKASGDLHKAQKYAQRAVDIDGKSVTNLACLARVYLAAGLKLNAQRELEKAAKLDPDDEMVKNLIREAR